MKDRIASAFFALLFGIVFGLAFWVLAIFISPTGKPSVSIPLFTASAFTLLGFVFGKDSPSFIAAWFNAFFTLMSAYGGGGETNEELRARHNPFIFTAVVIAIICVNVWLALR